MKAAVMYGFVSLYSFTINMPLHQPCIYLSRSPSIGKLLKRKDGDEWDSWINVECELKKLFFQI